MRSIVISGRTAARVCETAAEGRRHCRRFESGGNDDGSNKLKQVVAGPAAVADLPFPSDMECVPQPVYRLRADGKPGREITLNLQGGKLLGKAQVEVTADGRTEIAELSPVVGGRSACRVLLPADVGVKRESQVTVTLRQGAKSLKKTVTVPAMRHWTVYLYPHSHVDIGYTAPQEIAEFIHKRNIEEGIKLAEATKDYPAGARYRWNPEVTWPLERLWQTATPEQKERVQRAIRDGHLCVDASYVNLNTSVCCDEELFQVFRFSREMQKRTGVPMDTFQQMDVPGMSWGLVPVMAQEGVRYIMAWPNSCRAGHAHAGIDGRPFWWVGPDGKSKVLFLQPGGYGNSGSMGKGGATGRPWFGQRDRDKIPAVIKTGSANVDFTRPIGRPGKREIPLRLPGSLLVPVGQLPAWMPTCRTRSRLGTSSTPTRTSSLPAGTKSCGPSRRTTATNCRWSAATSPSTGPTAWAAPRG